MFGHHQATHPIFSLRSAFPLWRDPKPQIKHPATNRNIWLESKVKTVEGRELFSSGMVFSDVL